MKERDGMVEKVKKMSLAQSGIRTSVDTENTTVMPRSNRAFCGNVASDYNTTAKPVNYPDQLS